MNDRIEAVITINASLETVWNLVSEPGWWVGTPEQSPPSRDPGSVTARQTNTMGTYPVRVEQLRPQRYAAFRWASLFPDADLTETNTTLVEFSLDLVDGAVRVTVVESGFSGVDASPEQREKGFEDNSGGWPEELERLKLDAEELRA